MRSKVYYGHHVVDGLRWNSFVVEARSFTVRE